MAQTAAHLVESVMPWVPTRPWVVSVAIPLRYWTAPSCDLTAPVHSIISTTIAQFYANQAVKRGVERQKVQPGSVTFLQRFGGSLNLNLHDHVIAIEGVFSIASIRASNPVCSRVSRPAMRTWRGGPEHHPASHPHAPPAGLPGSRNGCSRGHWV